MGPAREVRVAGARELLERYVEAKDCNRPVLMSDIYRPDARLTFSITTDEISFPREVCGLEAITRTLVTDFGQRFVQCKTYYVCDVLPKADGDGVLHLPWLVVMREPAARSLRVGKGYYRWEFELDEHDRGWVRAMHIGIARMAVVPDEGGKWLDVVQRDLQYPWLSPAALRGVAGRLVEHDPGLQFLRDFREPVTLPAA